MRLVGFDEKLHSQLSSMKTSVKVEKCSVKRGRNEELEIILNRGMKLSPSPKKINYERLDNVETSTPEVNDVHISEIESFNHGTFVNTTGTVTYIKPARPVSTDLIQKVEISEYFFLCGTKT